MNWFKQLSIRVKLVVFMMSILLLTMILVGVAETIFNIKQEKRVALDDTIALANLIANNSAATIVFDDLRQAEQNLQSLKSITDIQIACMYKNDGTQFAFYKRDEASNNNCPKIELFSKTKTIFYDQHLDVKTDVNLQAETVGYIVLSNSLDSINQKINEKIFITIIFSISLSLLALLITNYLQKIISQPLIDVTRIATKIENEHDYSLRTKETGDDEIGKLSRAFNTMLIMIEKQNAKLVNTNVDLETQVAKRTEELQSVNYELNSFNYSVSHDLRSPLRAISGFSQIIFEDYNEILDKDGKDLLNRVINSASKMNELIEGLLKLSRLDRANLELINVNLSDIASMTVNNLKATDTNRKIDILIKKNVIVNGDSKMLLVLFENLIGNAWKYSSKCQKTFIEFGELKSDTPKERVFFIKDNGAGFDSSSAKNLFSPFTRYHSDDEYTGTGIGLATVRRIINRHNGKIWVESKVNEGATFYFELAE